jgi:hypothetical protein
MHHPESKTVRRRRPHREVRRILVGTRPDLAALVPVLGLVPGVDSFVLLDGKGWGTRTLAFDPERVLSVEIGSPFEEGRGRSATVPQNAPGALDEGRGRHTPCGAPLGEVEAACFGLVSRLGLDDEVLKVVLTRGGGPRGLSTRNVEGPSVVVSASGLPGPRPALRAISVSDDRGALAVHKTLNYLPNIIALRRAEEAGCGEAVFARDGLSCFKPRRQTSWGK